MNTSFNQQTLQAIWPGWRLQEHLGSGSYGSVYKAVHQENGIASYAAIKVISIPTSSSEISSLRAEFRTDEGTRTYLENVKNDVVKEIALMNSLKGIQNIVNLEDFKVEQKEDALGWNIYIRMELLTSLTDRIRQAPITELDVLRLGCDICNALEICERENIIHRDIKPDNIFFHPLGYYKLGDFGIAREMQHASSGLSKKGTPNYMAPEVAHALPYDSRADLYSLGLVLYRLLNGNLLPFIYNAEQSMHPTAREAALSRRLAGEPLPPPSYASRGAAAVILKACRFHPGQRFASAAQMRFFLSQVIQSLETSRPLPPSFWSALETEEIGKKKNHFPLLLGIAGTLLAVAIILFLILFLRDRKPSPPVDDSSSSALEESCEHISWDYFSEEEHVCHDCGVHKAHQWIYSDSAIYCSDCYATSPQQISPPDVEETELDPEPEIMEEESIPDPVLVAETALSSHDEWIVSVSNSSNGTASIHTAAEDVALGNFTDNFSTTWMNAYKFWLYKGDGYSNAETITYSLAGQSYNVLTGTIVGGKITSGRCSSGYSMYFNIYVDGVLAYTSPTVTQTTPAFTYEVNIESASTITIEGVTDTERVSAEGLITLNLQEYR